MQKVLHLLASGGIGGIEKLCVTMYPYLTQKHDFCFFWKEGVRADALKQQGATVYFLDAYSAFMGNAIKQVCKLCENNQYDVIVVHHASPLMWIAAVLAKKKYAVRVFLYAHSDAKLFLGKHTKQYAKQLLFWKLALKHTEKVIAISNYVKDSLLQYGYVRQDKIEVIYNGIELSKPTHKNEQNRKMEDEIVLIFCGRLVPEKGVHYLLRALADIHSNKKIKCYIVGDGDQRTYLEGLSEELGLSSNVQFCGAQSNIEEWLRQSDIYVHPAICEEGFGLSLVEAMEMGNICISYKKGGIPEFLQDGINGFLVETITPAALAKVIEKASNLVGTKVGRDLIVCAQQTATQFDIKFMAKHLEELL